MTEPPVVVDDNRLPKDSTVVTNTVDQDNGKMRIESMAEGLDQCHEPVLQATLVIGSPRDSTTTGDCQYEATVAERQALESTVLSHWEWLGSLFYIAFQSFFGGIILIKSLLLGQLFGWIMQSTATRPIWSLVVTSLAGTAKVDARAWPPPALLLLAVLTVFSLIVHPDGFTWLLARKIRDGMLSLLHSSTTCWAFVVNDYGSVVSTILAVATFCCLAFFCYVLHKTLAPRTASTIQPRAQRHTDKKRKKRKGHHHTRGSGVRTRQSTRKGSLMTTARTSKEEPALDAEDRDPQDKTRPLPALLEDQPISAPAQAPSLTISEPLLKEVPTVDCGMRIRTASSSTADSLSTADDQSCGSASGRSTPTRAVLENASLLEAKTRLRNTKANNTSSSGARNTPRRTRTPNRRFTKNSDTRSTTNSAAAVQANTSPVTRAMNLPNPPGPKPSRWDALKPTRHHHSKSRRVYVPPPPVPRSQEPPWSTTGSSTNRPRAVTTTIATNSSALPTTALASAPKDPYSSPSRETMMESVIPPASPSSEKLISCEVGASNWSSLGMLPPPTTTPTFAFMPATHDAGVLSAVVVESPVAQFPPPSQLWNTQQSVPLHPPPGLAQHLAHSSTLETNNCSFFPPPSSRSTVKENPFASDEDEETIEAKLQELGGQMVGSILDF